jgi:hypothetical protein
VQLAAVIVLFSTLEASGPVDATGDAPAYGFCAASRICAITGIFSSGGCRLVKLRM